MKILALTIALLLATAAAATADPGDRDRAFGRNGVAEVRGIDDSLGPVVMPDDGVVLADSLRRMLYRVTASGRLDRRFGRNGVVVLSQGLAYPDGLVRHRDGVVLASAITGGYTLTRFTARGVVDASFGVRGVATVAGQWYGVQDIVTTSDGRLLTTFAASYPGTGSFVARHTASGALDPTFGEGGIARIPGDRVAKHVFATPAGVLVTVDTYPQGAELVRLPGGGPVGGTGDRVRLPLGPVEIGRSPVGEVGWVGTRPLRGARLRPGGAFAFGAPAADGGSGFTYLPPGGDTVGVERAGHLAYALNSPDPAAGRRPGVTIKRLRPDGSPDASFGRDGAVRLLRRDDPAARQARLAVDRRGRIVAVSDLSFDFASGDREDIPGPVDPPLALIARYEGGVQLVRLRSARRVRGGAVRIAVACLRAARGSCRGTLAVEDSHGRRVGRTRIRAAAGARAKVVRVRLVRRARGRLVAAARITDRRGTLSTNRRRVR